MNVANVQLTPMNRLRQMRTIYAVLDTVKRYDAGYINGVMAQLKESSLKASQTKVNWCASRISFGNSGIYTHQ